MGIRLRHAKFVGALSTILVLLTPLGAHATDMMTATLGSPPTPAGATFEENRNLSAEEVLERTLQLNAHYDSIGDILSDSDAEFVGIYIGLANRPGTATRTSAPGVSPMFSSTYNYSKSGSGAGGSGTISGSLYLYTKDYTWENRYKGSITAKGSAAVTKIKACFNVRAYGSVGQSGVGVVYADDPCQTINGRSLVMSRDKLFSAFVVYSTITASAIFYTGRGSFQVSS